MDPQQTPPIVPEPNVPVTPAAPPQPLVPPEQPQPVAAQPAVAPIPELVPQFVPPTTTPVVGMVAPEPSPQAVYPQSFNQTSASGSVGGRSKKKLIIIIVSVLLALGVLGGGAFFALKFFSGVALENFSGDGYSVLVPKGYEKKDESGALTFEEKGGDKKTHSAVFIAKEAFPTKLTDTQKKTIQDQFASQYKDALQQIALEGETVENPTVDRTTHDGQDAFLMKATANRDGKKDGDIKGLVVINNDGLYVVVIVAQKSDPGVAKKMDTMINSFKIN